MPTTDREPVQRLTLEFLLAENRRHDRILAGLAAVLAFLLGSYPVVNPEIYTALRTGQMIVRGEFPFGKDPYSYTPHAPQGLPWLQDALVSVGIASGPLEWVHAGWLGDVFLYGVYLLGGGAGLVLLRALLMTGTCLLLLAISRGRGSLVLAAACTVLAMLVLSPRMAVRPEMFSPFLLALTLYLLFHQPAAARPGRRGAILTWTGQRPWAFLPLLFALWANLDAYFFLGPLAVACVLLGEAFRARWGGLRHRGSWDDPRPPADVLDGGGRRQLLVVFLGGLTACLLNPFHAHVFTLPGELSSEALRVVQQHASEGSGGGRAGLSPWEGAYFRGPQPEWYRPLGLSIAEWAFYPLALLSGASFLYNARGFRAQRLLLWGVFFMLAAWRARQSGYFAVVATPLMIWNFSEGLRARGTEEAAVTRRSVLLGQLGRIGLLLVSLVLLTVLLVPAPQTGLALAGVHGVRSIGFSLLESPSLRGAASQTAEWRRQGALPGRAFFVSWVDQPHYWAWFDPGQERAAFWDRRLALHGAAAREYFDIMQSLRGTDLSVPPARRKRAWEKPFLERGISHLVIPQGERVRRTERVARGKEIVQTVIDEPLVEILLLDRDELGDPIWELLDYVDGTTFVLGWVGKGSPYAAALRRLRYDPMDHAFGGRCRPVSAPSPTAVRAEPLRQYLRGIRASDPTARTRGQWLHEQVAACLEFYGLQAVRQGYELDALALMPRIAALLGAAPINSHSWQAFVATPPSSVPLQLLGPRYLRQVDAMLVLAARSARQAAIADPQDEEAAALLARVLRLHTYVEPLFGTRTNLPGATSRRDFAQANALRQAVNRSPHDLGLRQQLMELFLHTGSLDLAVREYQQCVRILRETRDEKGRQATESEIRDHLQRAIDNPRGFKLAELEKRVMAEIQRLEGHYRAALAAGTGDASMLQETLRLGLQAAEQGQSQSAARLLGRYLLVRGQQAGHAADPSFGEALRRLAGVFRSTGDVGELFALLSRPDAERLLGPFEYLSCRLDITYALGAFAEFQTTYDRLDRLVEQLAVRQGIQAGRYVLLGDAPLAGEFRESARGVARQRAVEHYLAAVIALEFGHRELAIRLLEQAAANAETFPGRPLAERLYFHLTSRWLFPLAN